MIFGGRAPLKNVQMNKGDATARDHERPYVEMVRFHAPPACIVSKESTIARFTWKPGLVNQALATHHLYCG